MVECVLSFEAYLKIHRLPNEELLRDRQIGAKRPWRPESAVGTRCVAEREVRRPLEHAGISEILVNNVVGGLFRLPDQIWPLSAVSGQRETIRQEEGQRPAIGDAPDPIRLPASLLERRQRFVLEAGCISGWIVSRGHVVSFE